MKAMVAMMKSRTILTALTAAWKSLLAFSALLITNVATRWVVNNEPLPVTGKDWIAFAVTTIGGTYLVWQGPANKKRATPRRRRRTAKPPTVEVPKT